DDFQITLSSPMEQSVVQGGRVTFNFNITPDAVFGGDVTIVCPTNIPSLSTCAPNPANVTVIPGTSAQFSITFVTTYNGVLGGSPGNGSIPGFMPRDNGGGLAGPGSIWWIPIFGVVFTVVAIALWW